FQDAAEVSSGGGGNATFKVRTASRSFPTAPLTGSRIRRATAVRSSNIVAARAVADAIRTSLGPRGMDKMIRSGREKP
ncbi:unnamed protein product, partial [Clonostachys rosea f. rosea IK726]